MRVSLFSRLAGAIAFSTALTACQGATSGANPITPASIALDRAPHATEKVVHRFTGGKDGAHPAGGLTYVNGYLWGTATRGGDAACKCGAVYAVKPDGGTVENYDFRGGEDGKYPYGDLTYVNGELWGTTEKGGGTCSIDQEGCGTVYAINPATGAERIVHRFRGDDGAHPHAGFASLGGELWGVTSDGGVGSGGSCHSGCGLVFKVDPATSAETMLLRFPGGEYGANPYGALAAHGAWLYGTTVNGGNPSCVHGCGTLFDFRYDLQFHELNKPHVMREFKGTDGAHPYGGLTIPEHPLWTLPSIIYGTTTYGGQGCSDAGCGTIFSYDIQTGAFSTLRDFKGGSDGAHPISRIAVELKVRAFQLFGAVAAGGNTDCTLFGIPGCGAVYTFNSDGGSPSVIYSFQGGSDGVHPGDMTVVNGTLYGVTGYGGLGHGTVYAITP